MSNMIGVMPAVVVVALQMVFVLVWCGIAAALLLRRGLLRLDVVMGRVRMTPEESPWILVAIGVVAVVTGLVAAQMVVGAWDVPEPWVPYVMTIALSVIGIAVGVIGLRFLRVDGLAHAGLQRAKLDRSIITGALALLAVLPVVYLVGMVSTAIATAMGRPPEPHDLLTAIRAAENRLAMGGLMAMAILLAPLFEELLFRGLMQTFLTRMLTGPAEGELPVGTRVQGRWQSILITSLLFAAIHGEPAFLPPLFVLSVGMGVAYERSGSLWVPMVMHSLFNGVQVVLFLLVMGVSGG